MRPRRARRLHGARGWRKSDLVKSSERTLARGLRNLSHSTRTMRRETPPSVPSSAGVILWLGVSVSRARIGQSTRGLRRRPTVSTSCLDTCGTASTAAMGTRTNSLRCRRTLASRRTWLSNGQSKTCEQSRSHLSYTHTEIL